MLHRRGIAARGPDCDGASEGVGMNNRIGVVVYVLLVVALGLTGTTATIIAGRDAFGPTSVVVVLALNGVVWGLLLLAGLRTVLRRRPETGAALKNITRT